MYSQKLSFNTSDCKNINNKCYLLITYFGPFDLSDIIGTEYTLLTRIWDKYEFIPQIISIPLNEYVFGNFDEKSVNHHYYTVFIPEDSENIAIEIHGKGINTYAINGIKKINKKHNNIYDLNFNNSNEIKILSKDSFNLNSFKNQYISFSIFKLNNTAYYYFRILQPDSINNIIIYPLDSSVENYCHSKIIFEENSCYFLLKNDYNDLSYNLKINELYDSAKKYSKIYISKKNEDYYSTNLENKIFEIFSGNLETDNITIDYYAIIKIDNKYKNNPKSKYIDETFLTILSNFYETSTSIQIYSYKSIYLLEQKEIDFNLNNKSKQFKLKIINNMPEKNLEIRLFQNNSLKANINNNYGKQISYLIEEFDKLEFFCENQLVIYAKFDYKKERQNLEEIGYHNSFKSILTKNDFPIMLYLKDYYNNGLVFSFYSENKIGNLDIVGYIIDFLDIDQLDKKRDKEYVDYQCLTKGIYDNSTQTGVIEFNKLNNSEINYKDIYYIIEINSDLSNIIPVSNIYINAIPKAEQKFTIPSRNYIRGIFNLTDNDTKQIYYIEQYQNKSQKNIKTFIEFSSNYKNIEILFDKKFKNITRLEEEYAKVYIIEGNIDKFTVKLKNNKNITINNSLIVNYIFKYYYSDIYYNTSNSSNVSCSPPDKTKKDERNITIKCNNNLDNYSNINYSYSLRLYQKDKTNPDEELNTIAITSSEIFYFNEIQTNDSNFNFIVNDISKKTDYLGILFIKYFDNNQRIYKIHKFEINVKDSIDLLTILIIAVIGGVILIILMILIIYLVKMKKKNKELEERVNSISFGIEDTNTESSDDDSNNRKVSYV